ncbi:MAG: metal-dependent hydrolase [Leptospirales bacterium]|jgi:inner membrane protein
MDSLTQIALGAAVGEAVAGRRAGNKAVLWGAVAGTIPDLDILLNPFLDQVDQLAMHRGISHSFAFAVFAAPVFGWLVSRVHRRSEASFRDWTLVGFFGFLTHTLLDYLTIYGTQLFRPFSDYPAALGTLFIIDPLYTVPLALGVLGAMVFSRSDSRRRVWNQVGLTLSSLYIVFSIGAKFHAVEVFKAELARQNIQYERLFVAPMPLNTILWMALADDPARDQVQVGLYSFLDDQKAGPIEFRALPKYSQLIAGAETTRAIQRLLWFSRGYYTVEESPDGRLAFSDLRFGRSDGWMGAKGEYIFVFDLEESTPGSRNFVNFERRTPGFDVNQERLSGLVERVRGKRDAGAAAASEKSARSADCTDAPRLACAGSRTDSP